MRAARRSGAGAPASCSKRSSPGSGCRNEADLDAIVAYLFAQKPVKHAVPPRKLDAATRARIGEE